MQKMLTLFNLLMAKTTPHDIAAGIEGGTVTVKRSSVLVINISAGTPSSIWIGKVAVIPRIARMAIIPINFKLS